MSKTAIITTRIDEALADRVNKLAADRDRSRAWIVSKAVERYVAEELDVDAAIAEGESQIDRGEFLTQEQMLAWAHSFDRRADAT